MKKHILLFVVMITAFAPLFAQSSDTTFVTITQDTGRIEKQRFIDRYDAIFGTKEPQRFMLKWNALPVIPNRFQGEGINLFDTYQPGLEVAAEIKIHPAFSILTGFDLLPSSIRGQDYSFSNNLEGRWYFDMPRRIRKGSSANNFIGRYISMEYRKTWNSIPMYSSYMASLNAGFQTRLLRFGYLDWRYGVGYAPSSFYSRGGFFGDAKIALGLILGSPKKSTAQGASWCEVLNCFREERSLFKVDLLHVLEFAKDRMLKINPNIAYEQKIGDSPFSIEGKTGLAWGRYQFGATNISGLSYQSASVAIEPRYYFLQKRQIARGKSGNNLNGLFFGINAHLWATRTFWTYPDNALNTTDKIARAMVSPVIGVQQRLFGNTYIGYNISYPLWSDILNRNVTSSTVYYYQKQLSSWINIGLAF
jgi:hypothetical protein